MRPLRDIEQSLDNPPKTQLTEAHLKLLAEVEEMRHLYAIGALVDEDPPFTRRQKQIQQMLKAAQSSQE